MLSQKRKMPPEREIFKAKPLEKVNLQKERQKVIARFESIEQLKDNLELCDSAFLPVRACLSLLKSNDNKKYFDKIIPELDRFAFSMAYL